MRGGAGGLQELVECKKLGLLTEAEFEAKRKRIIDEL